MKKDFALNEENLCQFLKRRREELGLSQRDMAKRLGYKNINFISILENNHVKLPFAKFPQFIHAYELPEAFINVFIMVLYPEFWAMTFTMVQHGICEGTRDEVEDAIKRKWAEGSLV